MNDNNSLNNQEQNNSTPHFMFDTNLRGHNDAPPIPTPPIEPVSPALEEQPEELLDSLNDINTPEFVQEEVVIDEEKLQQEEQEFKEMTVSDPIIGQDHEIKIAPVIDENVNRSINPDELLKSFIGPNFEKITQKPFNFAGFFFTFFYMFYRKMYLYALIVFILNFILLNIINNFAVTLVFGIVVGLLVNKIYISYAKNKINKIVFKNQGKPTDELNKICSSKGGVSVIMPIIGFINIIVIVILTFIIMAIIGLTSALGTFFYSMLPNANGIYDGVLKGDTSVKIANEFKIAIPEIFEADSFNDSYSYSYKFKNEGVGVFNECGFKLWAIDGYASSEKLINQMQEYYQEDKPTAVKTENINNIKWNWFTFNNGFGKVYYYGTTHKGKAYLFEFDVQTDAHASCNDYKDTVLKSITKK